MQRLWQIGPACEPALRKAADGDDPEAARRARRVLVRFRYGVFKDTPPNVVALIVQFRVGDMKVKRTVAESLKDSGEIAALLRLLSTVDDPVAARELRKAVLVDTGAVVPPLIVAGEFDQAEEILRLGALVSYGGARNLTAWTLLRGDPDREISRLTRRIDQDRASEREMRAVARAHLLRGLGRNSEAVESLAEFSSTWLLQEAILAENGDWAELSRRHRPGRIRRIDALGFDAAFHRLSGNKAALAASLDEIRKRSQTVRNDRWFCAEALLINEAWKDAVDVLEPYSRGKAFEVLCGRLRFVDAFDLIDLPDDPADYTRWFSRLAGRDEFSDPQTRIVLSVRVAETLALLGKQREARALLKHVGGVSETEAPQALPQLVRAGIELGLTREPDRWFEKAVAAGQEQSLLAALFPSQSAEAGLWWKILWCRRPDESRARTLARLRNVLSNKEDADPAGFESFDSLLESAEQVGVLLAPEEQAEWFGTLATTCRRRGRMDAALALSLRRYRAHASAKSALRVADLHAEMKRWPDAADWYRRAWDFEHRDALPLYLWGKSLQNGGDDAKGGKKVELARLMPLGESEKRHALARGLKERGFDVDAEREWRFLLKTGVADKFDDWYMNNAAQNLGNRISDAEPLEAADFWQRLLLGCLRTNTGFTDVAGYWQVPHYMHKARARGLLDQGDVDGAREEALRSAAARPGDVELAATLVPRFDAAGGSPAGDELFHALFSELQRVCRHFPSSAEFHHRAARATLVCRRSLDEGRDYAERSVTLEPQDAAYARTLALLCFEQGDAQSAEKHIRRALQLEPKNVKFKQDLGRIMGR